MTTRVRSLAIESITEMLGPADSEERRLFPPTELYSEGWRLRLVLDSAFRGSAKLPFPTLKGARWYSEARLTPEAYISYSGPGYDPDTDQPLEPITPQVAHTYGETKGAAEERAALSRAREAERRAKQAEIRRRAAEENARWVEQARQREEVAETAPAQKTKNGSYRRLDSSRVACIYRCRSRGVGEACVQRWRSPDERR